MAWIPKRRGDLDGYVNTETGEFSMTPPAGQALGQGPSGPDYSGDPLAREFGPNYAKQQRDIDRQKGMPDFALDERGFPTRLPPAPIAPQVQLDAERRAAERNSRIVQDSIGVLREGLSNRLVYRPGGAAAMQSPYYSQMANTLMADRSAAPDLMFDWRRHEAFEARRDQTKAAERQTIGTVAGIALGALTGGLAAPALGIGALAGIAGGAMLGGQIGSAAAGNPYAAQGIPSTLGMFASAAASPQGQQPGGQPAQAAPGLAGGAQAGAAAGQSATAPAAASAPQGGPGAPPGAFGPAGGTPQVAQAQAGGGAYGGPSGGGGFGGASQGAGSPGGRPSGGPSEPGGGSPGGGPPPFSGPGGALMPSGLGVAGLSGAGVVQMLEQRYGISPDVLYADVAASHFLGFMDQMLSRQRALAAGYFP